MSLEDIMSVPMAKQAQHDAAVTALDKASLINVNRLEVDDPLVEAEIEKIKASTQEMSQKLIEEGYNKSFKNKFNEMKSNVNQLQSQSGLFGKAEAAYKAYNDNVEAVNKNSKLTQQQRNAGLNWALNNYEGAGGDSVYKAYTGADSVNINKQAMDIASKLKPQEIASSLGMTYDPDIGMYYDGKYKTNKLPKEKIMQVVMQSMMNDEGIASYLQDAKRIGLIDDPQQALQNAAIDAANVFSVNNVNDQGVYKNVPKWKMEGLIDDSKQVADQGWQTSSTLKSVIDRHDQDYHVDPDDEDLFDGDNLVDLDALEAEWKKEEGTGNFVTGFWRNQDPTENAEILSQMKAKQQDFKLRKQSLGLSELSDREAAVAMEDLSTQASISASAVYAPQNTEHTISMSKELIAGENGADAYGNQYMGDIMGRRILDNETGLEWSAQEYIEQNGLDRNTFAAMLKTGSWGGVAPGSPDMPYGFVVSIGDPENPEKGKSIIISNSRDVSTKFNDTSTLTKNMMQGKLFEVETESDGEQTQYKHFVITARPVPSGTGRPKFVYSPVLITSTRKFDSQQEAMDAAGKGGDDIMIQDMQSLSTWELGEYGKYIDNITQKKH